MKKIIRVLSFFLCVSMVATLFAGCGNKNEGKLVDDDGNVIIRITVASNGTEKQVDALLRGYQKLGKKVSFKKETVMGDYTTKLVTQVAAHTAPDIIWLNDVQTGLLAGKGVLEPMDDYYKKLNFSTKDLYENMLQVGQYKGKQYMMPRDYDHVVTYYNKSIFKELGIKEPRIGWTWEEFLDTAYKIPIKKGDIYTRRACHAYLNWGATGPIILMGLGATFFDKYPNGTKANVNTKGSIEAFGIVKQLVDDGVFVNDYQNDCGEFESGKVGMVFQTRSNISGFANSIGAENLGVTTFPVLPEKHLVGSGSSGYGVISTSNCKDEAMDFVFYSVSEEGQRLFSETGDCVPILKSMSNDKVWIDSIKGIPPEPFLDSPEADVVQPCLSIAHEKASLRFDSCWTNALSGLLTNLFTVEEAVETCQKDLDSAFKRE